MSRTLLGATALAALLVACTPAPRTIQPADEAAARAFVTRFYSWYHGKPDSTKNIDSLVAQHRAWLAPDLAALVDSDNACAARTHGTCKLDEDPVLASQDPCQRYEVGGSITHNGTVGVAIYGVCEGKRDTIPPVVAVVAPIDSGWQIVNFVYPVERTDLRAILARKVGG